MSVLKVGHVVVNYECSPGAAGIFPRFGKNIKSALAQLDAIKPDAFKDWPAEVDRIDLLLNSEAHSGRTFVSAKVIRSMDHKVIGHGSHSVGVAEMRGDVNPYETIFTQIANQIPTVYREWLIMNRHRRKYFSIILLSFV